MFKFNISEEIIFAIRNMEFPKHIFNNGFVNMLLDDINKNKVSIFYGIQNYLVDNICLILLYKIFNEKYKIDKDINVFKIFNIEEIDSLYLNNKFQIFYLYDFFGDISLNSSNYKTCISKILKSNNKFLIVNTRYRFLSSDNNEFSYLINNLDSHIDSITNILDVKDIVDINNIDDLYKNLKYIDKLILFSIFFGVSKDMNLWIETMEKYLLNREIFKESNEFKELILNSFNLIEGPFIYFDNDKKFYIKNPIVSEYLKGKLEREDKVIKDILNNLYSYDDLINTLNILEGMSINYDELEYELYLKPQILNIISMLNIYDGIELFKVILSLFDIIGIEDREIIEILNNKISYSKINIDNALSYLCLVKENYKYLIHNEIFKNKLLNILFEYNPRITNEFYKYEFKYFLFSSEVHKLYKLIEEDELLDIHKEFHTLMDIILNNIKLYFTIEYFDLNREIIEALSHLKELITKFNIQYIFSTNIREVLIYVEDKFMELINSADMFFPKHVNEYHTLIYFNNELDRNKNAIEEIFENINLDSVIQRIKEKIYYFKA